MDACFFLGYKIWDQLSRDPAQKQTMFLPKAFVASNELGFGINLSLLPSLEFHNVHSNPCKCEIFIEIQYFRQHLFFAEI